MSFIFLCYFLGSSLISLWVCLELQEVETRSEVVQTLGSQEQEMVGLLLTEFLSSGGGVIS